MKRILLSIAILSSLYGCVTITPEAADVVVHSQLSNLLDDCERLGDVSASASKWTNTNALQQAKNDVRDLAYSRYGADTVAIVNADEFFTSATIQAIAFSCNR